MASSVRFAHFEEQYSRHTNQEARRAGQWRVPAGFDVYQRVDPDGSTNYSVLKDINGVEGRSDLQLRRVDRAPMQLTIDKLREHDSSVVVALAQVAFLEVVKAGDDVSVVARVPYDFDNPERTDAVSREAAQIYVGILEMQGGMDNKGILYTARTRMILSMATAALQKYSIPLMRSTNLPEKAA